MLEKFREVNRNKSAEMTALVLIVLVLLHLISIFCIYYKTKLTIVNPLIPKYLAYEIFEPYALKGLILTIGLLLAVPLKFFKQNLLVIIVCVIIIAFYHLTSFEPNFAAYQH